jgi:predicted NAD-dependent protein-ADP-ribosyltransferase YbiA (DUF1768 family)
MSDYFFYDMNKKMADLAKRQQLAEDAQSAPVTPAPSALRTQLNERDLGKHNNATTGFAALAKKTGGGEKGARIAGAQLAKMRAKGQVEEGTCSKCDCDPCKCDSIDESALQAAFGKKKYGDQGMKALQKAGRDHAGAKTMSNIRNKYDKYDEGMTDEGNAFSGAVVKAKRDGVQPGEKIRVSGKTYPVREADATPQRVDEPIDYSMLNAAQNARSPGIPRSLPPAKPAPKASAAGAPKPNPNVPGSMIKVGPDTGPVRKTLPPKVPGYNDSVPIPDPSKPVKEAGRSMTPKQKKFAALAKPFDKITFADKIVGAKKEVDEMLGDVAADAMKKAIGKGQSSYQRGQQQDDEFVKDHFARARNQRRNDAEDEWARSKGRKPHADMDEGFLDDEPTSRRSSTGGRIDTSQPGRTIHRAVKGNYSGAAHDVGADDEPSGTVGRRKVGAGQGTKIGAKINRGTSKLMTREGDMPEDMIEPQDSGEYDREGDMAKNDIHTMVRHAQDLEKMLSDNENLPEWVQKKINLASDYIQTAADYLASEKEKDGSNDQEMDEERTSKRDNRAERAGRKVAKDIEYDEKKKDGIHGKRRDSEDNKAERAGKKVTKDIEYDEKKDKKKKEVDETTSSGSVATSGAAPKSGGGHNYGKGIYDSLNRQLENMISESMNINMSMNNDEHGGPRKSLTVTATDEDAVTLAGLLKMAGMGVSTADGDYTALMPHGDEHMHDMTGNDSQMLAIQTMGDEEACSSCGSSPCGCDDTMDEDRWGAEQTPKLPYDMSVTAPGGVDVKKAGSDWVYKSNEPGGRITATIPASASNKMFPNTNVDEAYGDTDATQNEPDWPTDQEYTDMDQSTDPVNNDLNKDKIDVSGNGQTTIPNTAVRNQDDRELRRMMEIAGLR